MPKPFPKTETEIAMALIGTPVFLIYASLPPSIRGLERRSLALPLFGCKIRVTLSRC
jgi:hypothetical protein